MLVAKIIIPASKPTKEAERKAKKVVAIFVAGIIIFATSIYFFMNHYAAEQYFEEGVYYQNRKAYDKAMEKYLQVLQVDPKHAKALEKLGDIKLEMIGDPKGAIELYEQALFNMEKQDSDLLKKKGKAHFSIYQYSLAEASFKAALSANSIDDTAWYYLGEIKSIKGEYRKAVSSILFAESAALNEASAREYW